MITCGGFVCQPIPQLPYVFPCFQISFIQKILRSTPGIQRRKLFPALFFRKLFSKEQNLIIASLKFCKAPENAFKQWFPVIRQSHMSFVILDNVQGAGQGSPCAKGITGTKRQLPCAVTSHGKSGSQCVFLSVGHTWEKFPADMGQFLGNKCPVPHSVGGIRIKTKMGRRHHHRNAQAADIAFNGRPPLPDRLIIAHSMQQINGFVLSISRSAFHSDLTTGLLGKDHIHLHAHSQHI